MIRTMFQKHFRKVEKRRFRKMKQKNYEIKYEKSIYVKDMVFLEITTNDGNEQVYCTALD